MLSIIINNNLIYYEFIYELTQYKSLSIKKTEVKTILKMKANLMDQNKRSQNSKNQNKNNHKSVIVYKVINQPQPYTTHGNG